ncbi:hypothetical protein NKH18_44165 [Streptomyces sp. M10(2022)]
MTAPGAAFPDERPKALLLGLAARGEERADVLGPGLAQAAAELARSPCWHLPPSRWMRRPCPGAGPCADGLSSPQPSRPTHPFRRTALPGTQRSRLLPNGSERRRRAPDAGRCCVWPGSHWYIWAPATPYAVAGPSPTPPIRPPVTS